MISMTIQSKFQMIDSVPTNVTKGVHTFPLNVSVYVWLPLRREKHVLTEGKVEPKKRDNMAILRVRRGPKK